MRAGSRVSGSSTCSQWACFASREILISRSKMKRRRSKKRVRTKTKKARKRDVKRAAVRKIRKRRMKTTRAWTLLKTRSRHRVRKTQQQLLQQRRMKKRKKRFLSTRTRRQGRSRGVVNWQTRHLTGLEVSSRSISSCIRCLKSSTMSIGRSFRRRTSLSTSYV